MRNERKHLTLGNSDADTLVLGSCPRARLRSWGWSALGNKPQTGTDAPSQSHTLEKAGHPASPFAGNLKLENRPASGEKRNLRAIL